MSNDDKNAILALMPYKSQNSNHQETKKIASEELSVIDLLNGACYSLNIVGSKGNEKFFND